MNSCNALSFGTRSPVGDAGGRLSVPALLDLHAIPIPPAPYPNWICMSDAETAGRIKLEKKEKTHLQLDGDAVGRPSSLGRRDDRESRVERERERES